MTQHVIEVYSSVFSALEDKELIGGDFKGKLKLNSELKDALTLLENKELTSGSYSYFKSGSAKSSISLDQINIDKFDDSYFFEVDISSRAFKGDYVICNNWDAVLTNETKVKSPAKYIFFTQTETLLTPSSKDVKYCNYLNVQKVYYLVKRLAESTEGGDKTIFFERPLTFEFVLVETDLEYAIDVEALEKLLNKDLHQEAINCLICKELVSFLKDIHVKERFSYLIKHMSSLISNVLLSYQSYVESYTFDKVRKEYLEKRTIYVSKIHGVFDAIATKLLTLPAGIWFATSQINQLKAGYLNDISFYKNIAVIATVFILTVLLILNLIGQYSTLDVQQKEYKDIFNELKKNFEDEAQNIDSAKEDIVNAEAKVRSKLLYSVFASLALFGLTLLMFLLSFP
uniref:Putative phage-related membrane protein n=1 Tax=Rheinheimera sp. BAL341 TaxID=1708203 RepID=A0A486XIY2_9GAMM